MAQRRRSRQRSTRYAYLTWLLLAGVTTFHLWYIARGGIDLAPDEAHYWEWSRRLDWSYYSKGPMVAYLIAASTHFGPHTEFLVRLPAVLLAFGTALLVYRLTCQLFASQRAGFLAVLACSANPLYAAGSVLMTIDAPFVFFWAVAAYSLWQALQSATAGARRCWWLALGVALGCGVLSKYTMLVIVPCVGAYLLTAPLARPWLKRPEPYGALLVGVALCAPIVVWNARHDWVSFRHVIGQAGLAAPGADVEDHFTARTFFEFAGSQLAVISPLLCAAIVMAMITGGRRGLQQRDDAHLFLFMLAVPLLAFLLLWSVYQKVEGNWAAPAYLTATVALAGLWNERLEAAGTAQRRVAARIALVLVPGFLMVAVAHLPALAASVGLTLAPRIDLTRRLDGWKELGAAVGQTVREADGENLFLISDQYQIASELAFYVDGQPRVYNLNAGRRMNQYDIWGGLDALRGHDGLIITSGDWESLPPVEDSCEAIRKVRVVETSHLGRPGRIFSVFRCVRYKGVAKPPARVTY